MLPTLAGGPAVLNFSVYGNFLSFVHEGDRKDTEQTVQYDQGLFLASANSVW